MKKFLAISLSFIFSAFVIHSQSSNSSFDAYVNSPSDNVFTEILSGSGLQKPNDLDFNPDETNGFPALWVINEGTASSGGSTVTIFNPGESNQNVAFKKDGNSWHFMALPSALAFGDNSYWANSPNIFSSNHNSTPFTGPALWASDFSIYAITPPGGNGSHLDMLHQSPFSVGIAHEIHNTYWVADGYNQTIVMYDFSNDHGPGNSYHDDGKVHFYKEVSIKRDVGAVPGHLVLDKSTDWLYVCDAGNKRIIRMDIGTGTKKQDLPFNYETLAERWEMKDVTWEVIATGLTKPCGVDVFGDRLVVTDNGSSQIIIYDISSSTISEVGRIAVPHSNPNIRGVKVDYQGHIWFVDYANNKVFRLSNTNVIGIENVAKTEKSFSIYPNPASNNLFINFSDNLNVTNISIIDVQGNKVYSAQRKNKQINVDQLNTGLYFIRIEESNGSFLSQKFFKQ